MNKQQIFTAAGGALLFGGIIFSGPPAKAAQDDPAPVSAARPGDDALTCQQLAAESTALLAEMQKMTGAITQAASGQTRVARNAAVGALVSGIAGNIPIIGGLIGSIGAQVEAAGVEAEQEKLMEASEHMMERGTDVAFRLQHVETLRTAHCPAAQRADAAAE